MIIFHVTVRITEEIPQILAHNAPGSHLPSAEGMGLPWWQYAICSCTRIKQGGPYYKADDHGSLALAGAESEPHGSAGHQSNTHSAQTCTHTSSALVSTVVQVPLLLVC